MRTPTLDRFRIVALLAALPLAGCSSDHQGGEDDGVVESGGGGGATSGSTSTTTSSSTGVATDHPLCLDADPAVEGEVALTLSHWAPDRAELPSRIEFRAECVVRAASRTDRTGDASLDCTDDAGTTFDADLSYRVPSDVTIDLSPGQIVQLELAAHGTQGEVGPGMRFAIDDAEGHLVVAAYDDETYAYVADSWSSMIAPLRASMDLDVCPSWSCPTEARPECPDGGTYQRHGLIVSAAGESVHLVDGSRDVLATDDGPHDVLVASAAGHFLVSSRFSYRVLVAPRR